MKYGLSTSFADVDTGDVRNSLSGMGRVWYILNIRRGGEGKRPPLRTTIAIHCTLLFLALAACNEPGGTHDGDADGEDTYADPLDEDLAGDPTEEDPGSPDTDALDVPLDALPDPDTETDVEHESDAELPAECTLELVDHSATDVGGLIDARLRVGPTGAIPDVDEIVVWLDGEEVDVTGWTLTGNDIEIHLSGVATGIHDVRVSAGCVGGLVADTSVLKFHLGVSTDWRDCVVYALLLDRFDNGDVTNDSSVTGADSRVNWQGGDLAGVKEVIESGYFGELGVGAILISSPFDSYDGHEQGVRFDETTCVLDPSTAATVAVDYTGYDGTWPVSHGTIEPRLGTDEQFLALVRAAHERGIRVVVDIPINHVHSSSLLYTDHAGWFNWPGEGGSHLCADVGYDQSCWFAPYLADLDFSEPAAVADIADRIVTWALDKGIDGVHLDLAAYVDPAIITGLRTRATDRLEPTGIPFLLMGTRFTGSRTDVAALTGTGMLDGMLDYPLNMALSSTFGVPTMGLDAFDSTVRAGRVEYGDALMSPFVGDRNLPRFASLSAGDLFCGVWDIYSVQAQGWLDPPDAPDTVAGYGGLRLAITYIMTTPGMPYIYYGDEFGMPGAGDPDNRRMMRFDTDLAFFETGMLEFVQQLGTLRAAHPALRTGGWSDSLVSWSNILAWARTSTDETVIVVLKREGSTESLSIPVASLGVSDGAVFDRHDLGASGTGTATVASGHLTVTLGSTAAVIFTSR